MIRADGGPAVGAGHLGRCLALAEAWRDRGGAVTLVSDRAPSDWARRFEDEGVVVDKPDGDWIDQDADWVAVDGYALSSVESQLRGAGHRVLAIDDFGIAGPHDADLVLDQNLDVDAATYGPPALLGTRFALLRREFRQRDWRREVPQVAERLLIAVGGYPSDSIAALADASVRQTTHGFTVERLQGRHEVGPALASAHLALAASGSSVWELCCAGVPAVLVSRAANQRPVAESVAHHGVAEDAGPIENVSPGELAARLDALADATARRTEMIARGQELVDGRGAPRVVTRLLADLLALRPAHAGDDRLLWTWANDPEVRARAFSTDPISWETHSGWFATRLADPQSHIWIASEPGGQPLGQVRFETRGDTTEIAISVDGTTRGKGWGAAIIDAGVRRLFEETDVDAVLARVKPDNAASRRAFESADFVFDGEGSDNDNTWVRYARRRDARGC